MQGHLGLSFGVARIGVAVGAVGVDRLTSVGRAPVGASSPADVVVVTVIVGIQLEQFRDRPARRMDR